MGVLRTLLAISVVFAHTPHPYILVGGRNAVQIFYMISGFVISFVLLKTPAYRNPVTFWINRALRLYPAYYVMAALTLVAFISFNPAYWQKFFSLPISLRALVSVVNLTLIGQDWTLFFWFEDGRLVFDGWTGHHGILLSTLLLVVPSWTLGLELTFYLLAPFLLRRMSWVLAFLGLSLGARLVAILAGFGWVDPWTYRFFPFELTLFLAGALSHRLLLPRVEALVSGPRQRALPTVVFVGCMVICVSYFFIPLREAIRTAILLVAMCGALPFLFIFQLRNGWDKIVGDLSYPIYIGHLLVLLTFGYLIERYQLIDPESLTRALLAVALAIAFAVILKIFITDPIEATRRRIKLNKARSN